MTAVLADWAFDFRLTSLELSYRRTVALALALRAEGRNDHRLAFQHRHHAEILGAVAGICLWMAGLS